MIFKHPGCENRNPEFFLLTIPKVVTYRLYRAKNGHCKIKPEPTSNMVREDATLECLECGFTIHEFDSAFPAINLDED